MTFVKIQMNHSKNLFPYLGVSNVIGGVLGRVIVRAGDLVQYKMDVRTIFVLNGHLNVRNEANEA